MPISSWLNRRMNDVVSGAKISHQMNQETLKERLLEAWTRLRFHSPLIAARIVRGTQNDGLGSWVYTPVDNAGAVKWTQDSLHIHYYAPGTLDDQAVDLFIQEQLLIALPHDEKIGLLFHGYLLTESPGSIAVLLLKGSHTILDSPSKKTGRKLQMMNSYSQRYTRLPSYSIGKYDAAWKI